jgi:hypothetical protein
MHNLIAGRLQVNLIFIRSVEGVSEIDQLNVVLLDPVLQSWVGQCSHVLRAADDKLLCACAVHTLFYTEDRAGILKYPPMSSPGRHGILDTLITQSIVLKNARGRSSSQRWQSNP